MQALRQLEISTISVKTWHVNDSAATLLEPDSAAVLHQGDAYVVQWVSIHTADSRQPTRPPNTLNSSPHVHLTH